MEKLIAELDLDVYSRGMRYVATLSRLFSTSATPLVDSRFAEKLFCASTGAEDLSRSDMSFDALYDLDAGVGVKTFIATSANTSKFEKVAEFTKLGPTLAGRSAEDLAHEVARLRNLRVSSDAAQYGINISRSFYHCLIRIPAQMFIHEEPYELIDTENIHGIEENAGSVSFTDGIHEYRFSRSKTVLLKKFDLSSGKNSDLIDTPLNDAIWDTVLGESSQTNFAGEKSALHESAVAVEIPSEHVVLPLYSFSKAKGKFVAERSGINQWNAGGRTRKFGEAYIPVPVAVHRKCPHFFPPRDQKFRLRLPNGKIVSAKLCQDNSKALMSDPNELICEWLFAAIDGDFKISKQRFGEIRPYDYQDLLSIDRDAVRISKSSNDLWDYELDMAVTGSFEEFIEPYDTFQVD